MEDGNNMERFEGNARRFTALDALVVVGVAVALLVVLAGGSVRKAGEDLERGTERDLVLAAGKPAQWVAQQTPLDEAAARATAGLSPDEDLAEGAGFDDAQAAGGGQAGTGAVTAAAFPPAEIGAPAPPRKPLRSMLVTGDSLSTPLDTVIARRLAEDGVKVKRDPHLGTGISKSLLVDWGRLAATQAAKDPADAVVIFIGANEGFPMAGPGGKDVACCGAEWAAIYANRVRKMMQTYLRGGRGRVYWVTVPTPRDPDRQKIARVVNAAIGVAAQPWRSQVEVIDTVPIFTPGGRFRDAMDVAGKRTLVREADGIHLNEAGSEVLADEVLRRVAASFTT